MVGDGYAIVFKKYPAAPPAEGAEAQVPEHISRDIQLIFKTVDGIIQGVDEQLKAKGLLNIMPPLEPYEREIKQIFDEMIGPSRRGSQLDISHKETAQAEQRGAIGEQHEAAVDESQATAQAAGGTGAMHHEE